MENNSLFVDKYNKIYSLSAIEDKSIFQKISLRRKICQTVNTIEFEGFNNVHQDIRIYFSTKKARAYDSNIIYIASSPNIVLIEDCAQDLIIEAGVDETLGERLQANQKKTFHSAIDEGQAREIIMQINESAGNFHSRSLPYDCFSLRNIVHNKICGKWQLRLSSYLLGIDQNNQNFYHKQIQNQYRMTFALGCLLFKLVYGFYCPVDKPNLFQSGENLINYLRNQQGLDNRLLKTYYYFERDSLVSKECKDLILSAVKGNMSWENWLKHEFFTSEFEKKRQKSLNKSQISQNTFIRMTASAQPTHYSIIMASISYKQAHPYQRLNSSAIEPDSRDLLFKEALSLIKAHQVYCKINVTKLSDRKKQNQVDDGKIKIRQLAKTPYFEQQQFDYQYSFPCRDLIKIIQKQREGFEYAKQKDQVERRIKLHGYPFALAFELVKIAEKQPSKIQDKIAQAFQLLMRVSSFNNGQSSVKFTKIDPKFQHFQEIKALYRAVINELYEFFLNQAMRKYNLRVDTSRPQIANIRKQQGLDYYLLCLKLLEGSLLMRKKGSNLNLARIQTNSRKEIEADIANLLETYFPQRPQIH